MGDEIASLDAIQRDIRVISRLKQQLGAEPQLAQPELLRERFLSRVFAYPGQANWMLKGGTNLVVRIPDARATTDVDLAHTSGDLQEAIHQLTIAAAYNEIGDLLRFKIVGSSPLPGRQQGGGRVNIAVRLGTNEYGRFHVDLVLGKPVVGEAELQLPSYAAAAQAMKMVPLRLYPVVDHVADKVCATQMMYATGESSRAKDLVDLYLLACTQNMDGRLLHEAILTEQRRRSLPALSGFEVPAGWARGAYANAAQHSSRTKTVTFKMALATVKALIDPVLVTGFSGRWESSSCEWAEDSEECGAL